jgi:hypothetical protein
MTPGGWEPVLADWWRDRAEEEIRRTIPKAIEYGATDLAEIGRAIARLAAREVKSEQDATELGIYFYLVGKVARWDQALRRGERVSADTLFDLGVYVKMAQRNRDVGGWPFGVDRGADQEAGS